MLHQGGFERICILTAQKLKEKHNVTIAVFSLEDLAFDIEGLDVVNLDIPSKPGMLSKVLNIKKRVRKLNELQRKRNIDVSYSFGITANIANSMTKNARKKIVACHSFEEINNVRYMKLIGKRSDVLMCCSKAMASKVEKQYGFSHIQAVWNPCDLERIISLSMERTDDFSFFEREGRKLLVTMGREDDVKGYWHLMKIFAKVARECENTDLAVIGDGTFNEYKKMAEEMGISDRVIFTGNKRNPFPYLKAGKIFLLTSISEGLPNALVEAMTLSLPVVSVNCKTGPAEILHGDFEEAESAKDVFYAEYGILTPPLLKEKDISVTLTAKFQEVSSSIKDRTVSSATTDEVDSSFKGIIELDREEDVMANEVIKLLQNEDIRLQYAKKGPIRAQDFSVKAYCEKLEELFDTEK